MAAVAITVPGVGESITEGILARWLKADGAAVKAGEPLFELETDKASNVIPAPASGVLKVSVAEGETVAIGASVGTIDPEGQPASGDPKPAPAPAAETPKEAPARPSNGGAGMPLSPAVRRIVAEEKVDPRQVEGTGRGGRITKGDVLEHLSSSSASTSTATAPAPTPAPPAP